jgi:hypothetical protein
MLSILNKTRNIFFYNFNIKLYSTSYKNNKYTNSLFFFILKFVPFYFTNFIFNLFDIKSIYKMDDIYMSNYIKHSKINPILLTINIYNNNNDKMNIKENIKKYNYNVPFHFFINNEKLIHYDNIDIKYMLNGSLINKTIIIKDYISNKLIYDLFNKI